MEYTHKVILVEGVKYKLGDKLVSEFNCCNPSEEGAWLKYKDKRGYHFLGMPNIKEIIKLS